jgi:hypothetical protein
MTVLEAFTYATLSNNYMAWLYDYKHKNPASTVKTEYNLKEKGNNEEGTDNNNNEQIYCADLDGMEIAVLDDDGISGFKLVAGGSEKVQKSTRQYKKLQRR